MLPPLTKRVAVLVGLLASGAVAVGLSAVTACAQNTLPPGTIIPVRLNNSISSNKVKPGQTFSARIMQNVPLPDRGIIRSGSRVVGHVVDVSAPTGTSGARVSLKIDSLVVSHRTIPIRVSLRAIASLMEVEAAMVPLEGADRGTPPEAYVTTQVGGDVVYRGGGHVEREGVIVGEPVFDGVIAPASANPDGQCRADVDGNAAPQAMWVFSSDACGVYGYSEIKIVEAGRTSAEGTFVIAAESGQFDLRAGSGLLLRVNSTAH